MAISQITASGVATDTLTAADIADDAIGTAELANNSVTLAKMAGGTDGQIITYDASGDPVAVGPGTDGQVLTSTGAGSPPAFEAGFNPDAAVVFNESGADVDFRIESDDNANMFFVDGGNDRIGIGTITPLGPTHSYIPSGNAFSTAWNGWGGDNLILHNNVGAGDGYVGGAISFCAPAGSAGGADAQRGAAIASIQTSGDQDQIGLIFYTHPSATYSAAISEAMRIQHNGSVGIGFPLVSPHQASTPSYKLHIAEATLGVPSLVVHKDNQYTGSSQVFVNFLRTASGGPEANGRIVGVDGDEIGFAAWSDERLKEDIVTATGQLDIINQLRVVSFTRKVTGEKMVGFIAQEMETVLPECVGTEDDEIGTKYIVGWSKSDAKLVSAIQELSAKNDALETRIAILEAA